MKIQSTGRTWAYATLGSMLAVSISGNVAHTIHLEGGTPTALSVIRAVFWPVGLFLAVELFNRIPWERKPSHHLVRWGGLLAVAALAALVSYRHLRGLLLSDGEELLVANTGPLVIDGLMLMATLGLLLTGRRTPEPEDVDLDAVMDRWVAEAPVQEPALQPEPPLARWEFAPLEVTPAAPMADKPYGPERILWDEWKPSPPARTRLTADQEAKAKALILEGQTKADVASAVGTSEKTIQRIKARMVASGELKVASA